MDDRRLETIIFVTVMVAIGILYMWDRTLGNIEAIIYRRTGLTTMEGTKTLVVALLGGTLTLLNAFGVGVNEVQQEAIEGWLLVAWPVAMIIMRLVTKTPVKVPGVTQ